MDSPLFSLAAGRRQRDLGRWAEEDEGSSWNPMLLSGLIHRLSCRNGREPLKFGGHF